MRRRLPPFPSSVRHLPRDVARGHAGAGLLSAALAAGLAAQDGTPSGAAPSAGSLAARIDAQCAPLLEAELAVGFVVGVLDGESQLVRGHGRLAAGRPGVPDGDTVFEIGSITKVFTGLLLAEAVERGEVMLDDPVAKHLAEGFAMPACGDDPVRLWHLATHASGLPRMPPDFAPADSGDPYADYGVRSLQASLAAIGRHRAPGTRYEYSNLGAGLLGHVLVRAAGAQSYEDLLLDRVCRPLGMQSTSVDLARVDKERLALPHGSDGLQGTSWTFDVLAGAGGVRSTVNDMLRFARAQLAPGTGPLAKAIQRSQERRGTAAGGPAMALGWHFARDGVTLWHNGQTGGYHSFLGVQPKTGKAVCMLANSGCGEVDAVAESILQLVCGMQVEPPVFETPVRVPTGVLQRYVGKYRLAPGAEFTVELRNDALYAQLTGQPSLRLHARSETEFFYRDVKASVVFERGDEGPASKLVLHQNGRVMPCPRIE